MENQQDRFLMRRAFFLARKGAGKTAPNPMVGAVIVRHGRIVGEGYHHRAGCAHAEIIALAQAGKKAGGGTLYTNLEPCCHTEKRTPPCTDAIIQSGIARVVAAMLDPNPMVHGKGFNALRAAGIDVTVGLLQHEANRLNEIFIKQMKTKLPFVILKAAMTLDGRIATKTGESRWVTCEKARREVHKLRSKVDAVLVGIGTVLTDDPLLVAGEKGMKNPLRVVIDPHLKIPVHSRLVTSVGRGGSRTAPTLVLTTASASSKKATLLTQLGVRIESFSKQAGGIPFKAILKRLSQIGITSLLIEGGGNVNGRALREGIVDKVIFYIAPRFLCGNDAKAVVDGEAIASLTDAVSLRDLTIRKVRDDLCVEGYI
ncbi:MAG: bifunctional diaminohydroxyphosphoribosylaminopyrimidine deaminase/5-amino-6-(5-phosphoribosylamino)uracil reductase RibD [Nitrospirae bacterium]|nr:bifunctional diaminohydroxyphosphoribosylaminopyrimidine deaminase/5-amino-6-(5-phosphoribosylamino)uracil reductase RibD [Candidatus Troglogloeales bacterium]